MKNLKIEELKFVHREVLQLLSEYKGTTSPKAIDQLRQVSPKIIRNRVVFL